EIHNPSLLVCFTLPSFKSLPRLWISVGGGEKKRTRPLESSLPSRRRSVHEERSVVGFVSITNGRNYFGGHLWRVFASLLTKLQYPKQLQSFGGIWVLGNVELIHSG